MKSKEELLTEMQEAWNAPESLQQCVKVAERYAIEKQIEVLEELRKETTPMNCAVFITTKLTELKSL